MVAGERSQCHYAHLSSYFVISSLAPAAAESLLLAFKVADREHCMMLVNWRSTKAHGISLDPATADNAMKLLARGGS
jgi:hypothetical protein